MGLNDRVNHPKGPTDYEIIVDFAGRAMQALIMADADNTLTYEEVSEQAVDHALSLLHHLKRNKNEHNKKQIDSNELAGIGPKTPMPGSGARGSNQGLRGGMEGQG